MIAIKGMELPKTCDDCQFSDWFSCWATGKEIDESLFYKRRADFCPLVQMSKNWLELLGSCWLVREDDL